MVKFNSQLKTSIFVLFAALSSESGCNNSTSAGMCDQISISEALENPSFLQSAIRNGETTSEYGGLHTLKLITSKVDQSGNVWYILKYWDKTKIGSIDPLEINTLHSFYDVVSCEGNSIGSGPSEQAITNAEGLQLTTIDTKPLKY